MASYPPPVVVPDASARARVLAKATAALVADRGGATLVGDVADVALVPSARRPELDAAVRAVSAERLAWHAPRRTSGAIDPGAALALARYGDPDRRVGSREPWLVARVVSKSSPPAFVLAVEELISENESHRWDEAPWCWRSDDRTPVAGRWGGSLDVLGPTLEALDAGRWPEALRLHGIATDDRVGRLLAGAHADDSLADLSAAWGPRVAESMARLAPWRLAAATSWLRKGRPMRLFGLGGLNQQRKPGIFLAGDAAAPRLVLELSASNERVPEVAWTRPLDLDLVHAGLLAPEAVPGAGG